MSFFSLSEHFRLLCAEIRVIYTIGKNYSRKKVVLMDADVILIPYFAEVIVSEKPEKMLDLQFSALRQLQARLRYYKQKGYHDKLIHAIAEKKAEMIMRTTTKAEMEKVLHAPAPHYTGAEFISDRNPQTAKGEGGHVI